MELVVSMIHVFELSDDNNQRQRIRLSQLAYLAASNQYAVAGYPRKTIITDTGSRNKFVKNKDGIYCNVIRFWYIFNTTIL